MNKDSINNSNLAKEILDVVDAVILVLDCDGRILLFNKASEYLTGYTFADVKNKELWDIFILPEEIDRVKDVFTHLASGDFPNTSTNYWLTKERKKY